jgi:S1-C subfamily serine protease
MNYQSETQLRHLLQQSTVSITTPNGQGTGFFVAPGLVLTCAHVIDGVNASQIKFLLKE